MNHRESIARLIAFKKKGHDYYAALLNDFVVSDWGEVTSNANKPIIIDFKSKNGFEKGICGGIYSEPVESKLLDKWIALQKTIDKASKSLESDHSTVKKIDACLRKHFDSDTYNILAKKTILLDRLHGNFPWSDLVYWVSSQVYVESKSGPATIGGAEETPPRK